MPFELCGRAGDPVSPRLKLFLHALGDAPRENLRYGTDFLGSSAHSHDSNVPLKRGMKAAPCSSGPQILGTELPLVAMAGAGSVEELQELGRGQARLPQDRRERAALYRAMLGMTAPGPPLR